MNGALYSPRVTQAYERSLIVSSAEDLLKTQHLLSEQRRAKAVYARIWHPCKACQQRGATMKIQGCFMQAHLLNHRVYQAIGGEREWVQELSENAVRVRANFSKAQPLAVMRASIKTAKRRLFDWQHTTLKMGVTQRRKLGWVTLGLLGPIYLVHGLPGEFEQQHRWPLCLERHIEVCDSIARRLLPQSTMIFAGLLAPHEKEALRYRYRSGVIIEKQVLYTKTTLRFVHLEAR